MEIVISLEKFRFQIFRNQFQGRSEVNCKSPFGIRCRDEDHCPSGGLDPFEQRGLDSVLFLVALEKVTELIISDLSDEAGPHSENCRPCDGVCRRTASHILDPHRFEGLPDFVAGFHIHVLHTPARQVKFFQKSVVGEDCKYVRQRIPHSKDGFHRQQFLCAAQRYKKNR